MIEQACYTRANRQFFTGEAGYGVVAASGGVDAQAAERRVSPIGMSVLLENRGDFAYLALPSLDGRLSVSRAVKVQDKPEGRTCEFLHALLLDGEAAGAWLRGEPWRALPARVGGFREAYLGEPAALPSLRAGALEGAGAAAGAGGGAGPPRFREDIDPARLALADAGFSREAAASLLNSVAACCDHRGDAAFALKQVFVVYDCPRDAFERKAFALASLVYSCLPPCLSGKLGLCVKTDNKWRGQYPSGFSSAYWDPSFGEAEYVAGANLYILNAPPVPRPPRGQVFVARGGAEGPRVDASVALPESPEHAPVLRLMAEAMDAPAPAARALHESFAFLGAAYPKGTTFDDLCVLFPLERALRDPAPVEAGGWAQAARLLRLLRALQDGRLRDAPAVWQGRARALASSALACAERELGAGRALGWKDAALLYAAGCRAHGAGGGAPDGGGQSPAGGAPDGGGAGLAGFLSGYYGVLSRSGLVGQTFGPLERALSEDGAAFGLLLAEDARRERLFFPACLSLARDGGLEGLELLAARFGGIKVNQRELEELAPALYASCERACGEAGEGGAGRVAALAGRCREEGGVLGFLGGLFLGLLALDEAAPPATHEGFQALRCSPDLVRLTGARSPWAVKFWLRELLPGPGQGAPGDEAWQGFARAYGGLLQVGEGAARGMRSAADYRDFLFGGGADAGGAAAGGANTGGGAGGGANPGGGAEGRDAVLRHQRFGEPLGALDWAAFAEGAFAGAGRGGALGGLPDGLASVARFLGGEPGLPGFDLAGFEEVYRQAKRHAGGGAGRAEAGSAGRAEAGGAGRVPRAGGGLDGALALIAYGLECSELAQRMAERAGARADESYYCGKCHALTPAAGAGGKPQCRACKAKLAGERARRHTVLISADVPTLEALRVAEGEKRRRLPFPRGGRAQGRFSASAREAFGACIVDVALEGVTPDALAFLGRGGFRGACCVARARQGEEREARACARWLSQKGIGAVLLLLGEDEGGQAQGRDGGPGGQAQGHGGGAAAAWPRLLGEWDGCPAIACPSGDAPWEAVFDVARARAWRPAEGEPREGELRESEGEPREGEGGAGVRGRGAR